MLPGFHHMFLGTDISLIVPTEKGPDTFSDK
jgi:hypothetical protein